MDTSSRISGDSTSRKRARSDAADDALKRQMRDDPRSVEAFPAQDTFGGEQGAVAAPVAMRQDGGKIKKKRTRRRKPKKRRKRSKKKRKPKKKQTRRGKPKKKRTRRHKPKKKRTRRRKPKKKRTRRRRR
jgi:colicin import membrane protein